MDAMMVRRRSWEIGKTVAVVLGGSLLLSLAARVQVTLPYIPVPFSITSMVVLALGARLGPLRGGCAVGAYLLQGLFGAPVFSSGGSGVAHLLGATGGYLAGFVVAATAVGYLIRRFQPSSFLPLLGVFAAGLLIIYAFGVSYLALLLGWKGAVFSGLVPFLPIDATKLFLLAGASRSFYFWDRRKAC